MFGKYSRNGDAGDEHWWCHSFQWKVTICYIQQQPSTDYSILMWLPLTQLTKETILMTLCWCNEAPLGTWRRTPTKMAWVDNNGSYMAPPRKNRWVAFRQALNAELRPVGFQQGEKCARQSQNSVGHGGATISPTQADLDHLSFKPKRVASTHSPKAARILANKALDGAAKIEGGHQPRVLREQNVSKGRSG